MSVFAGRFAGRRAIITGGASGLGFAVANRIRAEGGIVSIWDLGKALAEAGNLPEDMHRIAVDVADPESVASAAAESVAALGKADILVCSAGITGATAAVHEYPLDSWRRTIDVNLHGVFHCCKAIIPHMLEQGYGRIVNIASVAGKEGNPNASAYSASKAGVIGLTKSLGKELATHGVIANALTPATFESPILDQLPETQVQYMRSRIPMGRLGDVSESAAMVCFMASEECSFTTGSVFDTSGGRTTY